MAITKGTAEKPEDLEAQLARLRGQVDGLMVDRITPMVTQFAADTRRTLTDAATTLRARLEAASRQVQRRPLTSVVIAAGLGVLIGRAIR